MKYYALLVIILIGAFLRLINLGNNPPSLYGDELTLVYDSYSILQTGHSQTGQFMPLTFERGDGRPGGYVYGSVPFVALFGPTALGVRLLSVISGLGLILCIYLLARTLVSKEVGLVASLLIAISPWDLSLSRGGFEAHFALLLSTIGVLAYLNATQKPWLYILSALSFAVAIHTYPTYKLTLPLMLVLLVWFGSFKKIWEKKRRVYVLTAIIILVLAAVLAIKQTVMGGSETRFLTINVFSMSDLREKIIQDVNEGRNLNNLPFFLPSVFHNRIVSYSLIIGEAYLKNLSPDFLFLHGDRNPRHNMGVMGGFYIVELLTIIVGFYFFWRQSKKVGLFILGWILISPLPTALLLEPHFLRSAFMIPPLIILSAMGLRYFWVYKNKFLNFFILSAIVIVVGIQFLFLIERLYFLSPNRFSSFWSYPAKLAADEVIKDSGGYKYIILSDRIESIEPAILVYTKVEPSYEIKQKDVWVELNGYKFKKYNNIYIGSIPGVKLEDFIRKMDGPTLLLASQFEKEFLDNPETISGKDNLVVLTKRVKK